MHKKQSKKESQRATPSPGSLPEKAPQAALDSMEWLLLALESSDTYWWQVDLRTHQTHYSSNAEKILGRTPAPILEDNLLLLHPEDRSIPSQAVAQTLLTGKDRFHYQVRSIALPDEVRWFQIAGKILRDAQDKPYLSVGSAQNITPGKQVEIALRISEERMRGLKDAFQATVNGMPFSQALNLLSDLVMKEAGNDVRPAFYRINEEGTRLYTIQGAGRMPQAYADQIDGFMVGREAPACGRAIVLGHPVLTMDVFQEPLWQPWIYLAREFNFRSCWSFPISRGSQTIGSFAMYWPAVRKPTPQDLDLADVITRAAAVIIASDTEAHQRKVAEEALRQADRRKDEFLAMLAHELRTPLASIRLGMDLLDDSQLADPVRQQTMGLINGQVDHLVRLVDELLDVSRISRGNIQLKLQRIELGALVKRAVDAIRGQFQTQDKDLHFTPVTEPLYVEGDATRLSQVVSNLLINGLRYTGQSGQVWVSLEAQEQQAVIRVADNGIGLSPDQLTAIFELFVQVDVSLARSQGGLGIGLTLVKQLVQMHGGQVEAFSRGLGQGSEFVVSLPLLDGPDPAHLPVGIQASARVKPQRILLIEDNQGLAFLLAQTLRKRGYEVHTRHNGQEGIKAAEALRPRFILCDIGMPGLDGYQTAQQIRQQPWGASIQLIAITGYGQEDDKRRVREAGFDAHLLKPIDTEALFRILVDRTSS